jgi:hypothetical protein
VIHVVRNSRAAGHADLWQICLAHQLRDCAFAIEAGDAVFWAACNRRELRIQCCADCGTFRHPPVPVCHHCRSMRRDWTLVPGTGTVFSFTIAAHPMHPSLRGRAPYNIAVGRQRRPCRCRQARPGAL